MMEERKEQEQEEVWCYFN